MKKKVNEVEQEFNHFISYLALTVAVTSNVPDGRFVAACFASDTAPSALANIGYGM